MERLIYIKTQFVGFHKWADAPDQVAFLRNLHRHIFHVTVTIPVTHNDREIEFFICKTDINKYIESHINCNDTGSCEMIAEQIAIYVNKTYNRNAMCEVSEDEENGAIVSI